MQYIVAYLVVAVAFLVIDYFWIAYFLKDKFYESMGHLMADEMQTGIAAVFYLFYAAGVVYLCVHPALQNGNWMIALLNGVVLGALAYGTYEITNLATLKGWSAQISVIDIAWGTFLTSFTAVLGYFAVAKFFGASAG